MVTNILIEVFKTYLGTGYFYRSGVGPIASQYYFRFFFRFFFLHFILFFSVQNNVFPNPTQESNATWYPLLSGMFLKTETSLHVYIFPIQHAGIFVMYRKGGGGGLGVNYVFWKHSQCIYIQLACPRQTVIVYDCPNSSQRDAVMWVCETLQSLLHSGCGWQL